MNALAALVLIGAAGFLFGRFLFLKPRPGSWYERFILSGAEFLLLGALVGPSGLAVLDERTLLGLEPFLILALSWVGLLIGLQLQWRHLVRFPWKYFQVALIESTAVLSVCLAAFAVLFSIWSPVPSSIPDRWRAALCLAAIAALSSPTETVLHDRSQGGHVARLLQFVPAISPVISLLGVAVLFSLWHMSDGVLGTSLLADQWLLVSALGGVVLGILFVLLLWAAGGTDEMVLVVLGMALFSGGMASVFQLSPLVICFVEGLLIGHLAPRAEGMLHMFLRLERPLYVALLVLAGATWPLGEAWGYVLGLVLVLFRLGAVHLGTRAALLASRLPFAVPPRWWLGLVPQGAMAIAIAMSYYAVYRDDLSRIVFSAVLVSTMFLTMISGRLVNAALPPAPEEGGS